MRVPPGRKNWCLVLASVAAVVTVCDGCSDGTTLPGSSTDAMDPAPAVDARRRGPPMPGTSCLLNADCENPLACAAGTCREQCAESRDCDEPSARCVRIQALRVCLLPPETALCSKNSDCLAGLICARDLRCRNECISDVDCSKGQKCIEQTCADSGEYDPVKLRLYPPPPGDGGAGGSAGTNGDGGLPDGP